MVGKAKAPEHKINTSLLECEEVKNYYMDENKPQGVGCPTEWVNAHKYKQIFLNETIDNIKSNFKTYFNSVCIYS